MKIERRAMDQLIAWKNKPSRKPLILQGVRQTGKTWMLREFGRSEFEQTAYFSFDENPELKQFFQSTKEVGRIIRNLSLVLGKPISPGKTLIILDEIQECNEALNSLKYFCENAPEYAIACAGSLLGVALSKGESFPVGNVDFIDVHPLTFMEFLRADEPDLADYCTEVSLKEPVHDLFFNRLTESFKMYLISGGMPEAVTTLLGLHDTGATQSVLSAVIRSNTLDFSKHVDKKDVARIGYVWASIPSQLARENKKFIYQAVRPGARAREYEDALNWLVQAGLVAKVFRVSKPALPLSAYDDLSAFKLYLYDVGLLRRLSLLDPVAVREGDRLFTEFNGALSENYILQSLAVQFEGSPRYWTSGNEAELDFLIQYRNQVIPIEVKAGLSRSGKSLTQYRKQFLPAVSLRYSLKNLRFDEGLLNIPLFLADHTHRFLDEVLG